jgi:peptidoglycan/xylan/chitin deacetylase (PgdA/CDA1 family)
MREASQRRDPTALAVRQPAPAREQGIDVNSSQLGQHRVTRWTSSVFVAGLALSCSALLALASTAVASPQSAETPANLAVSQAPVVVSLTFDDGNADQYQTRTVLANHAMQATFFVNSGRIGLNGYMTQAQLAGLQNDGNEIGGHTVSHADLPTLDADEQKRQICNDRVALLNQGFTVTNFAYPYGDTNLTTKQIAASCGYNSARGVGDIVSPGTCDGCPYAEQMPPVDPYKTDTPDSVKRTTTLDVMQGYVTQAETHGGGWVQLVFHHVCDGCDPYSVRPSTLASFLDWLAARAASGTTVKTVREVIGGSTQPGVSGPPPAPPESLTNLLKNPSLEDDSNGDSVPNCWQRGGYGTNTYTWAKITDAHTGNAAQQAQITNYTSGDRKLISSQDLGSCAPSARAGHAYHVAGWYKSNAQLRLVAYSRISAGGWLFWSQSPVLAPASNWTRAAWTTPQLPSGATAVSVGFSLRSTGSMTVDDFVLADSDQTPPSVSIDAPADGSLVRGIVPISASASDNAGVDHVDFLVNGNAVGTDNDAPYSIEWDSTAMPDSVVAVTARAVDTAGNVTLSTGRNYTVANTVPPDTTAPSVSLTAPADGATVSGSIILSADAVDDDKISAVDFMVDGKVVRTVTTAPYTVVWNTTAAPDGPVAITARAVDRSANETTSAPHTVTVANSINDTAPPVTAINCNTTTCGTGWYTSPVSVALSASDTGSGVAEIRYTLDGTDPTDTNGSLYTAPFALSTSATVRFRAWDNAGNVEAVNTQLVQVDTQAPTDVAVTAPANGATVSGTVYIKAQAIDNVAVARIRFYLDGKQLGSRIVTPWQWKWDTTTVTKGTHTIHVLALDAAGNATTSASIGITVA